MKKSFCLILIATIIFSPFNVRAQVGSGSSPASVITPTNPTNSSTIRQLNQTQLANQKAACLAQGYYWLANNTCSRTSAQTSQTLQRFQPSVSMGGNGSDIGGVSFKGIGSSILSCANVGTKIINAITNVFNNSENEPTSEVGNVLDVAKKTIDQPVLVEDKDAKKKLDEANKKLDEIKKKENCTDAIAYTLAKQALGQITNKTLNWINTGFGGNPFYIRNIDSFLGSVKNEQIKDYLRIADNIKAGDGDAVGTSVTNKILEMVTGRSVKTPEPSTPSEIKYDNFTKDFSTGGWDAWYRMTQLGENPIAGILSTSQQLGKNISQQQESVKQELVQGNGFLSQKKCVEYAQAPGPDDDYNFNTNADGSQKCLKYETVTPGSVIASQTQTITNSSTRQLEAADELNEVLGNFFDSLLNKLFNKGLQTLGRDSGDSFGNDFSQFGGTGNNIVIGSNGQPINGTGSGVVLPYNQGADDYDAGSFNISNPRHIASIIKSQKTFLNRALDSQASLQKIIPNLGHLDYCLPGPHPSWQNEIGTNSQILFGTIGASGLVTPTTGFFNVQAYDLFDTIKNDTISFPSKKLLIKNGLFVSGADIANILSGWLQDFENNINTNFSQTNLSDAFASTENTVSGQQFARGFVVDAVNETALLPNYLESVIQTDSQYESAIAQTQSAINELESIRAEVLDIVTTARNRHIATKKAQGITVNISCLNEAYDISNAPITGQARVESDATVELNALGGAKNYFYNNL